jgi:hypothetical protein
VKCSQCAVVIEGELIRCGCTVCNGMEGRVEKDGVLIARAYGDRITHLDKDACILALMSCRAELQTVLGEAIDDWGIRHDMNCVTQPPWDQDYRNCDCGRSDFIKKCRTLMVEPAQT